MTSIDHAVDLLERWEGFRARPYKDSVGVHTVGFGFTAHLPKTLWREISRAVPLSKTQARTFLRKALRDVYMPAVEGMTGLSAPHKLGAYTSFTYNVGVGALRDSTLLKRLKEGEEDAAEEQLLRWVYAGGKVVEGLVARRKAEKRKAELDETLTPDAFDVRPMSTCGVEPIGEEEATGWSTYLDSKLQNVHLA